MNFGINRSEEGLEIYEGCNPQRRKVVLPKKASSHHTNIATSWPVEGWWKAHRRSTSPYASKSFITTTSSGGWHGSIQFTCCAGSKLDGSHSIHLSHPDTASGNSTSVGSAMYHLPTINIAYIGVAFDSKVSHGWGGASTIGVVTSPSEESWRDLSQSSHHIRSPGVWRQHSWSP